MNGPLILVLLGAVLLGGALLIPGWCALRQAGCRGWRAGVFTLVTVGLGPWWWLGLQREWAPSRPPRTVPWPSLGAIVGGGVATLVVFQAVLGVLNPTGDGGQALAVLMGVYAATVAVLGVALPRTGYARWWLVLAAVPGVNVVALWVFSLRRWPRRL
jgi:hypothetical protein